VSLDQAMITAFEGLLLWVLYRALRDGKLNYGYAFGRKLWVDRAARPEIFWIAIIVIIGFILSGLGALMTGLA